jgi:hypothetical protein
MNILICIGANSRIIQKCLQFEEKNFDFTYLISRNSYYGILPTGSMHIMLEDPLLILLKIKEISGEMRDCDEIKILYSSFYTDRSLKPAGFSIWDPGFSLSLQCMVLNRKNLTQLVILGSTQAVFYPFLKDFYLTNKVLELQGFLQLTPLDSEGKLCYLALPPLDGSQNLFGKIFIKTRKECAVIIVGCLYKKSKFLIPRGVYGFIAEILFGKYFEISKY